MRNSAFGDKSINLKNEFLRFVKEWPYYLISLLGFLLLALLLLWLITPRYVVEARILIRDKNNSVVSTEKFDESLDLFRTKRNLENEMGIIKSYPLLYEVLKDLPFAVGYYKQNILKKYELYPDSPFEVILDTLHIQVTETYFRVRFLEKDYFELSSYSSNVIPTRLHVEKKGKPQSFSMKGIYRLGQPIIDSLYSFTLVSRSIKESPIDVNSTYCFHFHNTHELTLDYLEKLQIEQESPESSIILIKTKGELVPKECDFLNKLSEKYVNAGLEEKNTLADRTIAYINDQLRYVSDSMEKSNQSLLDFNTKRHVVDIDAQTKHSYEKLVNLERERATLLVKMKYYKYLFDYVNSSNFNGNVVAPSTIGIDDQLLNNLLSDLSKLNQEKVSLSYSAQGANPNLQMVELKIENTKKSLKENVRNILEASEYALSENSNSMKPINSTLNSLPSAERELLNLQRLHAHHEQIYSYLRGKRAEAEIARASSSPHHVILDKAKLLHKVPYFPNKLLLLSLALFFAILFPTSVILIRQALKPIVLFLEDIETNCQTPLIGSIFAEKSALPQTDWRVTEDIKKIKALLSVIPNNSKPNIVIGISSASKNEGKSFLASRLAIAYAKDHNPTVLLDFNLRKPALSNLFGMDPQVTLNEYLIFQKPIADICYSTSIQHLTIIPASTGYPPDLEKQKLTKLLSSLKEHYSIIIIDASPCVLFSDYNSIIQELDVNLFVIRKEMSSLNMVRSLDLFASTFAPQKSFFVFNGEERNEIKRESENYGA